MSALKDVANELVAESEISEHEATGSEASPTRTALSALCSLRRASLFSQSQ